MTTPPIPADVLEKINEKYPIEFYHCQNTDGTPTVKDCNRHLKDAAQFGYSLALPQIEALEKRIKELESECSGFLIEKYNKEQ